MLARDYNRQAAGHLWNLGDLPADWDGRAMLAGADKNNNGVLEGIETAAVWWSLFTEEVQSFQGLAGIKADGKLGRKTLKALRDYFPDSRPPKGDVLLDVAGIEFKRPTKAVARPDRMIEGHNGYERRIAALWNNYGAAIADMAAENDIPVRAALAVFATEAGNRAYDKTTGLIIIRFEQHVFKRKTGIPADMRTARKHDGRQETEWRMLRDAAGTDPEAAFWSTSFGLPQIMGFNHAAVGYADPVSMATAFQADVTEQVKGFFSFCRANGLDDLIRRGDWREFTRRYNGPGQVDHYSGVLTKWLSVIDQMGIEV